MKRSTAYTVALLKARRAMGLTRPRRRLPRMVPPDRIGDDATRAMIGYYMPVLRRAFAPLFAELPRLVARVLAERRRNDARFDASDEARRVRQLIRDAVEMARTDDSVERIAERYGAATSSYQREQFDRVVRAGLGSDVVSGTTSPLGPMIEHYVDANVGLIAGLTDETAKKIEGIILDGFTKGLRHEDLAALLEQRLGMAEDRAKLIARDQVLTLYGQVNAARQRQIGVTRFRWMTVNDARVRDEHTHRQEVSRTDPYSYDDPPDGELPGEPILCRCYAEPVLEDILDALED